MSLVSKIAELATRLATEINTVRSEVAALSNNIDGGSASSTYLPSQNYDGGSA